MALLLHIDTSIEIASICLSRNEEILASNKNENIKDHSSWLQAAMQELMAKENILFSELDAIAVTIGPGSYTGLRVGLSTAKGLCYALNIPLITIGTLELLAFKAKNAESDYLCPMIDARRMEVFTAVYDLELNEIVKPHARILDENSFGDLLESKSITFFGNGSVKFQNLAKSKNSRFENIQFDASDMLSIAYQRFTNRHFANLVYAEPAYIKDFYTPCSNNTTKIKPE